MPEPEAEPAGESAENFKVPLEEEEEETYNFITSEKNSK